MQQVGSEEVRHPVECSHSFFAISEWNRVHSNEESIIAERGGPTYYKEFPSPSPLLPFLCDVL